jgi:hypothetical protein
VCASLLTAGLSCIQQRASEAVVALLAKKKERAQDATLQNYKMNNSAVSAATVDDGATDVNVSAETVHTAIDAADGALVIDSSVSAATVDDGATDLNVSAETVQAAIDAAGEAVVIRHRPCALSSWGGRALDRAEAIEILAGPAAEGAWTVNDERFDVRPVDAGLPWSGRAVAALTATLGDDGRARVHLEGATLEEDAAEAWLERCEGSIVAAPARVALDSACGFRCGVEALLAFYDAAAAATKSPPFADQRVVLACRTAGGAVARVPGLLAAPHAGLVAAWVAAAADGPGAWRAVALEARARWHLAPSIVERDGGLAVATAEAWRPGTARDLWTAALDVGVDVPTEVAPADVAPVPAAHLKKVPRDRPFGVRRLLKGRADVLIEVAVGAAAEHAFASLGRGPLRLVDGHPPPVLGALAAKNGVAVCDNCSREGTVVALSYDHDEDDETPPAFLLLVRRADGVLVSTSPPFVNPLRRREDEGAVAVLRLHAVDEPSPDER